MRLTAIDNSSFDLEEAVFSDLIESNDFEALTTAKTLIERRLTALRDEQIARLRQHVLEQTALLGLTPAGLFEAVPTNKVSTEAPNAAASRRAKGTPKYQDPNSAATWTGKGKPPLWMKAHLDAGGDKDDLLIPSQEGEDAAQVLDELS